MSLCHADLAGLWESAGSERENHVPSSERHHFPVAGTYWLERRESAAGLVAHAYQLTEDGFTLSRDGKIEAVTAWMEAGFLILRGEDEHETWCRKIVS